MKSIIIYSSTHHGNTKKLVDAIAAECEVEVIDAAKAGEKDLKEYDLIGFASGIFYTKFAAPVLAFASANLPADKDVFFIATAGNTNKGNFRSIEAITEEKKCRAVGRFQCKGFDTYGPMKLIGGINKDRPNDEDLKAAVDFYKGIFTDVNNV